MIEWITETGCVLLGVMDGLSADGRLFKGDPGDVGRAAMRDGSRLRGEDAMIIVGGLLTLLSVISLVGFLRRQRLRPHALVLFNRVARRSGLTWADRWLLWRIGRGAGLPTPLTLMLCPGTLGFHARSGARRRMGKRRATLDLARAASIRRHLFGPGTGQAAAEK
ncbi:MAG: hypothetical protein AAFX76_00100 [Planctomycetota bacterium]